MSFRKTYIIIHGTGGTLRGTLRILSEIDSIKAKWWEGVFYTDKKTGLILRKILSDADDDSICFGAIRKIILSRLLRACENPQKPEKLQLYSNFDEANIIDRFPDFDIPYGPASRKKASERLQKQGENEFISIFRASGISMASGFADFMNQIIANLYDDDASALTETEASVKIATLAGGGEIGKLVADDFIQLRDMGESGADLDTVSSATFYAHALANFAKENGSDFKYGKDYDFVFVNYHQGLLAIAEEFPEPGDIYMADIPISTIPDLPGDIASLSEKGYRLIRYEDHHPYTMEQLKMLADLHSRGFLAFYSMTGPLQGGELPNEQLKCGGDMVYEALIMGRAWDTPAMAYLRKSVHGEDLAQERTEEGKLLTELIKGGTNSIEIIQTLLSCRKDVEISLKLSEKGWVAKIAKEREEVSKIESKFKEAIQILQIERPPEDKGMSGESLGFGSDMPLPASKEKRNYLNVIIAMAPYTDRKEPKLKIGRAQEYFARTMPEADYLLYCYGSSLIVARRLNQADFSLNLSVLMRKIGTENDGGHAGAAVCGPDKNPNYPKTILGRVNKGNFKLYCRYLEKHILETVKVKVLSRRDISETKPSKAQEGGIYKLMALAAATIIIGIAVLIFNPNYRIAKIAEMNKKDFFIWFGKEQNNVEFDAEISDESDNERLNTQ